MTGGWLRRTAMPLARYVPKPWVLAYGFDPEALHFLSNARYRVKAIESPMSQKMQRELARQKRRFDYLVSGAGSEDGLAEAARLRERLAVPHGMRLDIARRFTDKLDMKKQLRDHAPQIRTAAFVGLSEWPLSIEKRVEVESLGFPLVIKPTDQCGAIGVKIIKTPQQLSRHLTHLGRSVSPDARYIAEKFVSGTTMRIDGFVLNEEVMLIIPQYYLGSCLDYYQNHRTQLTLSDFSAEHEEEYRDFVTRIAGALELHNGVFHIEAIRHRGKLYFLEIANRPGGGSEHQKWLMNFDYDRLDYQLQLPGRPNFTLKKLKKGEDFVRVDFAAPLCEEANQVVIADWKNPYLETFKYLDHEFTTQFQPRDGIYDIEEELASYLFVGPGKKILAEARQCASTTRFQYKVVQERARWWPHAIDK
jgi:carbamoylphosphate synthase large subunit